MSPKPSSPEIITTVEELKALGPEWDRLSSRFPSPLLTHDWFCSAAEALHPRDKLAVFVRRSGAEISAIAPFVSRRRHGLKSLEVIGYTVLCEPTGILYSRPGDLRDILEDLASHGLPVHFDRVDDPLLVAELTSVAGGTAELLRKSLATSPWIHVAGRWETYYSNISSSWRSAHRRATKKAESAGPLSFEFFSPGPGEQGPLLEKLVAVEGESWKSRLGTALKTNEPLRNFFERYSRAAAARGAARFAFMSIGGVPVAAQLAVEHAGRHWLLKIGYDERYSYCSPGILLMYKALERVFDAGLEGFEFLGSNESWIQIWSHKVHRYYTRAIDRKPARRLLASALALSDRVNKKIRRGLARTATGS